jgi:hypothetical protein
MPAAKKNPFDKGAPAKGGEKDKDDEDEPGAGAEGAGDDEGSGAASQPTLQLDSGEATGFIRFFQGMEAPADRTVRFFHRKKEGEFYSCHGDDAIYIAQECFHTMSVVKYLGKNNELPAVTVSTANFNSFAAQLLTERQYRVEVWGENKVRILTAAGGALVHVYASTARACCKNAGPSAARWGARPSLCRTDLHRPLAGQEHVEHHPAGLARQP